MAEENFDKAAAVKLLNEILETELAGVVRYTHYALMVFGHNRFRSPVGCAEKHRLALLMPIRQVSSYAFW